MTQLEGGNVNAEIQPANVLPHRSEICCGFGKSTSTGRSHQLIYMLSQNTFGEMKSVAVTD